MSIRLKVALPYVLLTVLVSLIGAYVVTRLVAGTLTERLTNQLLEAGRVVSDSFVRQESHHVGEARRISFTAGLAVALANEDHTAVAELAEPAYKAGTIENLILISSQGNEIIHLLTGDTGEMMRVEEDTHAANLPIVDYFLKSKDPNEPPRRGFGANLINNKTYYYTAMPVSLDGEFYGVILVGTSIQTLLPLFEKVALADIVLYGNNGQAIATTLGSADEDTLAFLSISGEQYREIIMSEGFVEGDNFKLAERDYTLGRAPLQIGNDRIGVFAVVLPSEFVMQFGEDSRVTYAWIFVAVMLVVIAIGSAVSRTIIKPLLSLVSTSQAIAGGDLDRRTGIQAKDEIGTLASTFDEMTSRLQERTKELERTNAILQKMDKTKSNFIQISAHELRTPLTLIMGYSQMLEQDTAKDPELSSLARGILEGAERMTDVVESMLDVSRIDSDALIIKRVDLLMDAVIQRVEQGFDKAFKERKIKFETEGLTDLPVVAADPDQIQKVFTQLVMNAIKFTPDGGKVKVTGRYLNGNEPPQVEISVCDTGIGVASDMTELIFEKFNQTGEVLMHSSGKTKFKGGGPGLGLAIARGIVEAHGGRIRVESPGYNEKTYPGSTFIVSLPVNKETEKAS